MSLLLPPPTRSLPPANPPGAPRRAWHQVRETTMKASSFSSALWLAVLLAGLALVPLQAADAPPAAPNVRETIAKALMTESSEDQVALVKSLTATGGPEAAGLLKAWKEGGIFIYEEPDGKKTPVTLDGDKDGEGKQAAISVLTGKQLTGADGKPLKISTQGLDAADTDGPLRAAIKEVTDMASLSSTDSTARVNAVKNMGLEQNPERLSALQARLQIEKNSTVVRALQEAIALTQIKDADVKVRMQACQQLGSLHTMSAQDALKSVLADANKNKQPELAAVAQDALAKIARHVSNVNIVSTLFHGLSASSVLLVVTIGLAITFGLMGVINMAHGELLAVGAYTTYVVQCIFGSGLEVSPVGIHIKIPGMHFIGVTYDAYFIVALPCSFLVAALVGILLERSIIRFLYKRPLESLLATWGVSLVMQQLFRLTFGANNVQVDSPSWLSGNWTINDVDFGWNRVFVICFAVAIIVVTWAVLNKTPLGLLIRAVMQNRQMAACMGVRTERVNMLTFGFGSGLAGLAGAFVSQLDNTGPSLGQHYIMDSFMTVVVGGVGNLIGTVLSALGIGVVDQSLQQILLNPVLGKVLVLATIILFLQWRPQGLFVTKSRSLES